MTGKAKNFLGYGEKNKEGSSYNRAAIVAAADKKKKEVEEAAGMSCGAIVALIASSLAVVAGAIVTVWCCCCTSNELPSMMLLKNGEASDMHEEGDGSATDVSTKAQAALDSCVAIAKNSSTRPDQANANNIDTPEKMEQACKDTFSALTK